MKADKKVGEKAAQQTQADPRPKPSTNTVVAPSECQRPFPPTNAVRKSSLVTSDSRSAVPPVTVTSSVAVTPPKASSADAPVDPRSKLSSSDAPVDPRTKPSCLTVNSTVQPQPSLRPNAPPAFSLPLPPPPAPPLNIHTYSPLLHQVNAQSAVRPALPYPPASAHLQQRLVNQALTNYHQAYRPHPPPLVNQPPFTQSSFPFSQFHQPVPASGSPHVLHSPYFFSSDPNPFSLYGQGPPPQQQPYVEPLYVMNQPVNHFGMVAPQLSLDNHNSLLGESSQHSFGLVVPQPLLHGTPVAPPTHHDNLHVLTSGNTHGTVPARPVHPVPVSPPKPPLCPKPTPPPPPPTLANVDELMKEAEEAANDMDISAALDLDDTAKKTRNGGESPQGNFEPMSVVEEGELSDDGASPALRIDLEPISDAEEVHEAPQESAVAAQGEEVAITGEAATEAIEQPSQQGETMKQVERCWLPLEYSCDEPVAKLLEVVCAIEDGRFMIQLEGCWKRTLTTMADMQKYYFEHLIAYLQRFRKEPVPKDFALKS